MSVEQKTSGTGKGIVADCQDCWSRLPNKLFFFILLAAWLGLFHFLGNATFGYVATPSLLGWMSNAYSGVEDDSHGAIVPYLVIFLLWYKREELLSGKLGLWSAGLGMVVLALFLHVLGYSVQQPRISIVAMFLGIYGIMGMAWGPGWLKRSFFPFFLFAFCIPMASISEPLTFPMRLFVAKVVEFISGGILGVDVLREGTQLFDSKHTYAYEVAAACSGIRSLVAIFGIATVYAFLFLKPAWKRVLMILSALPLAILSNVLRLLFIILAAELFGKQTGDYVHASGIFSVLPYVPALIGVMVIGRFLEEKDVPTKPPMVALEEVKTT